MFPRPRGTYNGTVICLLVLPSSTYRTITQTLTQFAWHFGQLLIFIDVRDSSTFMNVWFYVFELYMGFTHFKKVNSEFSGNNKSDFSSFRETLVTKLIEISDLNFLFHFYKFLILRSYGTLFFAKATGISSPHEATLYFFCYEILNMF